MLTQRTIPLKDKSPALTQQLTKRTLRTTVASAIYITKACHMIKVNLLTSLLGEFCIIYAASFSVDSVSEQNMPSPCVVAKCKGNYKNGPKVHYFSFPKVNIYLINRNMPLKGRILPQVHLAKWVVKILITIYFTRH